MTNQVLGIPDFDPARMGAHPAARFWEEPLRKGLALATEASELRSPSFRLEFTGDSRAADGEKPGPVDQVCATSLSGAPDGSSAIDSELEFLSTAAEQCTAGRPDGPAEPEPLAVPSALLSAATTVARPFGRGSALRWLGALCRVYDYQHDDQTAARVRAGVVARIGPQCRVVIGHAVGSLAAWETLAEHPELSVDTLLTLGSPLAIEEVHRRLRSFGTGARLPNLRRWVNIFDPDDPAGSARLGSRWPGVQDYGVDSGPDHGSVQSYLNKRITGRTVAEAFPENQR